MEQAANVSLFSKIITWIVTSLSGIAAFSLIVAVLSQVILALVTVLGISLFAAKVILGIVVALAALGAFFIAKFAYKFIAKGIKWLFEKCQGYLDSYRAKRAVKKAGAAAEAKATAAAKDPAAAAKDAAEAAEATAAA